VPSGERVDTMKLIDAAFHIVEPVDLWTSRLGSKDCRKETSSREVPHRRKSLASDKVPDNASPPYPGSLGRPAIRRARPISNCKGGTAPITTKTELGQTSARKGNTGSELGLVEDASPTRGRTGRRLSGERFGGLGFIAVLILVYWLWEPHSFGTLTNLRITSSGQAITGVQSKRQPM
jgi:hypothetical protein